jgi:inorganic pyrophosphatase
MFHMRDEAGGDDKILCIPAGDPRKSHITELEHISEFDRLEIQHFFETYKDLEPGKSVEGAHWTGREEAEQTVNEAIKRAKDAGLSTARWRTPEMGNQAIAEYSSKVRHTEAELDAAVQRAVRELATKENPLSDD